MAGVFSAQANDSSAIWYNPAGLKSTNNINKDYSIEYANTPSRKAIKPAGISSLESSEYGNAQSKIKFAAAYLGHLPFRDSTSDTNENTFGNYGIGIAYLSLLEVELNIDAPRNPVDPSPFGITNASYQQLSASISRMVNTSFSIGGTLDFVLTDIDCLEFDPCVSNGPTGFGLSIGTLSNIYRNNNINVNFSVVWRSKATLKYNSTPGSGIGTVLDSYIPDRPESRNIGLNLQLSNSWAFLNTNIIYEKVLWSDASGINPRLVDSNAVGISAELLFPLENNQSFALRTGSKHTNNSNTGDLSGVDIVAFGFGYGLTHHHFIDIAYESRKASFENNNSAKLISLSYSQQF